MVQPVYNLHTYAYETSLFQEIKCETCKGSGEVHQNRRIYSALLELSTLLIPNLLTCCTYRTLKGLNFEIKKK